MALLMAAFVMVVAPARAADPAAKALKQASRAAEKAVRLEGGTQLKDLKAELKGLLINVATATTTPTDALGDAVLAAAKAGAAVSTRAFDGVGTVRDDAVDQALGGGEGSVLLGEDFQAGGGGIWDDFITRMHGAMDRVDAGLEKELRKFVVKLEKLAAKLDMEIDVHLQVRMHDVRIDAIQCPASLVANPGMEAAADIPIRQVHIEARIVTAGDDFTSHLGIRGFGNLTVDLEYVTNVGNTLVTGVPMLPSGVALSTRMIGLPGIGPYRIDVLDSATGERADSVGGRPPSTRSSTTVNDIVKQARKSMKQDLKFFGQVTGQIRGDYRKEDAQVCKDHANGSIDTETALDLLFSNHRNALGGTNFWRRVVFLNPVSFAESAMITEGVADEDIPDDLAADAGGAFTTHIGRVHRRYVQRCRAFVKIGCRSIGRVLKKAAKDGENVEVNARFARGGPSQGPTITTLGLRVLQFVIRPSISVAGIISMEVSPGNVESTALLIGRTPPADVNLAVTHVNIPDGQTIVIGGLTSSAFDNTFEEKIPLLGNLPLIGRLFKVGANENANTDVVMLVTPRVFPVK